MITRFQYTRVDLIAPSSCGLRKSEIASDSE